MRYTGFSLKFYLYINNKNITNIDNNIDNNTNTNNNNNDYYYYYYHIHTGGLVQQNRFAAFSQEPVYLKTPTSYYLQFKNLFYMDNIQRKS